MSDTALDAECTTTTAVSARTMPKQKRGESKQDYQTPPEFLQAVRNRLKIHNFTWDLAATDANKVSPGYYGPGSRHGEDALACDWSGVHDWKWLNPPYADIKPWVEKAAIESAEGAQIAMLIPASVGANWWSDYVINDAYQLFLNGRLTFVGCDTPYPKDCALLLYTPFIRSGNAIWTWKDYI